MSGQNPLALLFVDSALGHIGEDYGCSKRSCWLEKLEVLCGDKVIPWEPFRDFLFELETRVPPTCVEDNIEYRNTRHSPAMKIVMQTANLHGRNLWALILATSHLRCAEEKDHVYALLGVAQTGIIGISPKLDMPFFGCAQYRFAEPT